MKLAVLFPGIGYHVDKPLMYYGRKLAVQRGYEAIGVPYGNFPDGVKGSPEKMKQAFLSALGQAEEILGKVDFGKYEEILFISKSVGTAVASAYGAKHGLRTRNLYFTPVEESFLAIGSEGIAFHGTADPWARTEVIEEECRKRGLPLYETAGANHSLETGNVQEDLKNLAEIMRRTEEYIRI